MKHENLDIRLVRGDVGELPPPGYIPHDLVIYHAEDVDTYYLDRGEEWIEAASLPVENFRTRL